ncbi:VOC family protein [Microbacterium yannicii]|uniref:VOC family protein n=1 Tax=Microbacterium yannicii TaxID=671622 RepID=A0ABP9M4J5_9MICO|nr:VOC family protein [Microbacterium yannicii]MCO5955064.1 VOC family protein [Microbacterium yannicii]
MPENNRIDLVELPAADPAALTAAREFYESAFGWTFTSYGDGYADTSDSGVAFGLNGSADSTQQAAALPVLFVDDLEAARARVAESGGTIRHDIYGFPGGRRFHFVDPAGNELAVWSHDPAGSTAS